MQNNSSILNNNSNKDNHKTPTKNIYQIKENTINSNTNSNNPHYQVGELEIEL